MPSLAPLIPPGPLPRAILWDLDGTLIDTAPLHWQAWREVLPAETAARLTWAAFLPTFGLRNDTLIPMWLESNPSPSEMQRISEEKEARYRELLVSAAIRLAPGADRWLARLAELGWRQAIATMTPRRNLEIILRSLDIGKYLDACLSAEDAAHGKPAPDIFLAAAQRIGVPPAHCVVIEDSPAGVEAAKRAGMRVIGVGAVIPAGSADVQGTSTDRIGRKHLCLITQVPSFILPACS